MWLLCVSARLESNGTKQHPEIFGRYKFLPVIHTRKDLTQDGQSIGCQRILVGSPSYTLALHCATLSSHALLRYNLAAEITVHFVSPSAVVILSCLRLRAMEQRVDLQTIFFK